MNNFDYEQMLRENMFVVTNQRKINSNGRLFRGKEIKVYECSISRVCLEIGTDGAMHTSLDVLAFGKDRTISFMVEHAELGYNCFEDCAAADSACTDFNRKLEEK